MIPPAKDPAAQAPPPHRRAERPPPHRIARLPRRTGGRGWAPPRHFRYRAPGIRYAGGRKWAPPRYFRHGAPAMRYAGGPVLIHIEQTRRGGRRGPIRITRIPLY